MVTKTLPADVGNSVDGILCCTGSSSLAGEAEGHAGPTCQRPATWPCSGEFTIITCPRLALFKNHFTSLFDPI